MKYIEDTLMDLSYESRDIVAPNYVFGGIDPYIEWIKWLSYEPEFEKIRIDDLNSKKICDLTKDELHELTKYKEQERILKLFKIYGTDDITKEEYMDVYKYMEDNNIEDLMISKLSKEELKYVKNQIEYYCDISDKELNEKVRTEQQEDNYKNLSMKDSYILHKLSKINFKRGLNELDEQIRKEVKENDVMQYRSMQHASKFICR